MNELTEKQIENVARWLRKINCDWARSTGRDMDGWDAISDEKRDGYRYVARALAPALESQNWRTQPFNGAMVHMIRTEWLAHIAAVKAVTGEAE